MPEKKSQIFEGEYHGIANATVYKPIGSDVIIRAGNLHVGVKSRSVLSSLVMEKFFTSKFSARVITSLSIGS